MIQRKFFIKEKNRVMQQKLKKGIGNMKGSMWQCGNHKRQKEQRFKSGGEQGTDRFSASVHTADCDPRTKIQKGKSKEKKSLCFSFVRASYCLAFLVTIHLFPSCQHADNQHQSTFTPVSLFFSLLCFSS